MDLKNKKGIVFADMLPMVITFIIVGITIVIGVYLIAEMREGIKITSSASVANESLTSVENATGEYVANSGVTDFNMGTSPVCINQSNAALIPTSNYTATTAGLIKSTAATCPDEWFCIHNWNCTYTYGYTSENAMYNSSLKVQTGMGTFANMLPIIAIALVFAVIISIIVGFLVVKSKR